MAGPNLKRAPWTLTHVHGARLASLARRLYLRVTHLHAELRFAHGVFLGSGFSLWIPEHGTLEVGSNVVFRRGCHIEIAGEGRVSIGAGTVFTSNALIQCSSSIEIGRRCQLGQSALIVDGNHRFRDTSRPTLEQGYDLRPIRIGDDVLVTTKCTVLADIGEHSVIGANSVVSRDIPPYSLAVGAPAKVIESFEPAAGP